MLVILLAPQLAHADPLDALGYFYGLVIVVGVFAMVLVPLLGWLAVRSYRQPERRGLRAAQLGLLLPAIALALLFDRFDHELMSPFRLIPLLLQVAVWGSVWLGAVTGARLAQANEARLLWGSAHRLEPSGFARPAARLPRGRPHRTCGVCQVLACLL